MFNRFRQRRQINSTGLIRIILLKQCQLIFVPNGRIFVYMFNDELALPFTQIQNKCGQDSFMIDLQKNTQHIHADGISNREKQFLREKKQTMKFVTFSFQMKNTLFLLAVLCFVHEAVGKFDNSNKQLSVIYNLLSVKYM